MHQSMTRILTLLVISALSLGANDGLGKRYVSAISGLRVRDAAGLSGRAIAKLAFNDEVVILERSSKIEMVDGLARPWVRIQFKATTGWVYEGYLAEGPLNKLTGRVFRDKNFEIQFNCFSHPIVYRDAVINFGNCQARRTIIFGMPLQPTIVQVSIFQRDQFQCLQAADPREASAKVGEKGNLVFLFSWNVDALPSSVKPYEGIFFKMLP